MTAVPLPKENEPEGLDDEKLNLGNFPLDSLMIRTETRSVFEVSRRIDSKKYVMDPDFQRDFIWEPFRQSKLIESALLRIPLPVFYLAEMSDGKVVVVDGLQRLTSFHRFVHNEFKLIDLKFAEHLNGKRFKDLEIVLQNRLEDTPLTLYLIDSAVHDQAKYEIFERVNGGIALTRQQMRNCLYSGPATRWLNAMAKHPDFVLATDESLDSKTMRDRECINRFAAFHVLGWEDYAGDMDEFLNSSLRLMNSETDFDKLTERFTRAMRINTKIFGDQAFRKSIEGWEKRSKLNVALFDVFSIEFAGWTEERAESRQGQVFLEIQKLLSNSQFKEAISYSTNSTKNVRFRFEKIEETLGPLRP